MDDLPVIDTEQLLIKRRDAMRKAGEHPLHIAIKALEKAKKTKADPFTIKRLEEALAKESKITGQIILSNPFLSKILTNQKEMDKFLDKKDNNND